MWRCYKALWNRYLNVQQHLYSDNKTTLTGIHSLAFVKNIDYSRFLSTVIDMTDDRYDAFAMCGYGDATLRRQHIPSARLCTML